MDAFAALLGALTFLVGVAGAVRAGARLSRSDLAQTVEVQHEIWQETRAQLEDCRAEVAKLRGP
jgi:hypothetical protein